MPSRRMTGAAGLVFHVLNRGVRRMRLFDGRGDYVAFLALLGEAQRRVPIRCLSYCIMPNHFHLVLWPTHDGQLSAFMFWLTVTHSKRWHVWHGTAGTGHVYQGRFKAFPVAADDHFLRVCRYVERNPLRAGLVKRAEEWPWSSLAQRLGRFVPIVLEEWPVPTPRDWLDFVNAEPAAETAVVRESVTRGFPLGPDAWKVSVAAQLNLSTEVRRGGRPRKTDLGSRFPIRPNRKPTPEVGF